MPNNCGDSACNCVIHAGDNSTVTGSGHPNDPYIISSARSGTVTVKNSDTIDLTVTGQGTPTDPTSVTANLSANLTDLDDVTISSAPPGGWVLGWNGSQWVPQVPTTAQAGTILTQGCLGGDGSSGNPLYISISSTGRLICNAQGLSVTTDTNNRLNLSFANAAARDAVIISPASGMEAWLDDRKLKTIYTGTKWVEQAVIRHIPMSTVAGALYTGGPLIHMVGSFVVTVTAANWGFTYPEPFPNGVVSVMVGSGNNAPGDGIWTVSFNQIFLDHCVGQLWTLGGGIPPDGLHRGTIDIWGY